MVRRRARLRMEGLPEDSDRLPGGGPEPEQVFSDTHLDPALQAALDELAPEFRAAVVLCDVEGLSYEEIGATLGVKLGTVRSRIHRGRAALRAALERHRAEHLAGAPRGAANEVGVSGVKVGVEVAG
jgi:RNA polymerase sigma-70 factor (ECF subfamily)